MCKYIAIRKAFAFLQSEYGFLVTMKQRRGSYYYIAYSNQKKEIMVLYDDTTNKRIENPIWIRIYDSNCLGTAFDDVSEYRSEFFRSSGTPKEQIRSAAYWLRGAIEDKTIIIESQSAKRDTNNV